MKPAKSLTPEAEFRSRLSWFLGVSDPLVVAPEALTYEPYFGLREKPFSLAADPRFFFTGSGHGTAFDTLAAGIKRREGILVLTGEVGTGKTTLCRAVLESLDRKTFAAFVTDPFLSREDLLKTLLVDFGVVSAEEVRRGGLRGASRGDLSYPLHEFLASLVPLKAFAVVIIDEAQSLSPELLDEIRVLSDLEQGPKLLQVFLVGQPELETRLAEPGLRQIAQRVSIRSELPPLTTPEVARYISHRLAVAGDEGRIQFTEAAVTAVHDASGGIPRVVNLLCDRALTRAASLQSLVVDADSVLWGRNDLKLAGTAQPALSLVHSQPARPAWRDIAAETPAPELAVPPAPDSLVHIVSGVMDEHDRATTVPSSDTSPSPHSVGTDFSGHPDRVAPARAGFLLVGVALAAVALFVAYRSLATTPPKPATAEAPPPQLQRPARVESPGAPVNSPTPPVDAPVPQPPAAANASTSVNSARVAILMATFVSDDRTAKSLAEIREAGFTAFSVEVSLKDGERALVVYVGPYNDRVTAEQDLGRARALPGYETARIVAIKSTVRP